MYLLISLQSISERLVRIRRIPFSCLAYDELNDESLVLSLANAKEYFEE